MEKFAHKIEQLLQEKLSVYEEIYAFLLDEKAHIVNMNIDGLWDTVSEKKSKIYRIEMIRHEITDLFKAEAPRQAMKMKTFRLADVITNVNVSPEKRREMEKIDLTIRTIKQDISRQALENSKFIKENLSIINGIFATIMDSSEKEEEYNQAGGLLKHESNKRLFNAQV